jgi:hypothetical protein
VTQDRLAAAEARVAALARENGRLRTALETIAESGAAADSQDDWAAAFLADPAVVEGRLRAMATEALAAC